MWLLLSTSRALLDLPKNSKWRTWNWNLTFDNKDRYKDIETLKNFRHKKLKSCELSMNFIFPCFCPTNKPSVQSCLIHTKNMLQVRTDVRKYIVCNFAKMSHSSFYFLLGLFFILHLSILSNAGLWLPSAFMNNIIIWLWWVWHHLNNIHFRFCLGLEI